MKAGAAGGVETVVEAISTHIINADVCHWGCGALWNMTLDNGKTLINSKNEMNS